MSATASFERSSIAVPLSPRDAPRHREGVCIWLTGRDAYDKSAIAGKLAQQLLEYGRATTILDGNANGQDLDIRRVAFVAAEIVRHSGIVVCAVVSPSRSAREEIRQAIVSGPFVEVFVDAPMDRKERFEPPVSHEITLQAVRCSADEKALAIVDYLVRAEMIERLLPAPTVAGLDGSVVAHSLTRWAEAIVKSIKSPSDLRTLDEWGRFVGVSVGGLRNWCRSANLPARRSLLFARVLRAVLRQQGTALTPDALLNVVDRRTLAKLLVMGGGTSCQLPSTLDDFLARQRLIEGASALTTVRTALRYQGQRNSSSSVP